MHYGLADLKGAEVVFDALPGGGARVVITRRPDVDIRFEITPATVHGLRDFLHRVQAAPVDRWRAGGWEPD